MKVKVSSDEDLAVNKALQVHNMVIIIVRSVFHKGNKY